MFIVADLVSLSVCYRKKKFLNENIYVVGTQNSKEPSQWEGSLEHPQQMLGYGKENIYSFTLKKFGYLNQWIGVSRDVEIIIKKYLPTDK